MPSVNPGPSTSGSFPNTETVSVDLTTGQMYPQTSTVAPVSYNPTTGAVSAGGVQVPANGLTPVTSTQPLRYWSAALGKMRNGTRNAKLLMIGDSTTVGYGSTGAVGYLSGGRAKNMPVRLATEMNKQYEAANAHAIWCDGNIGSLTTLNTFDSRVAFGTGWSLININSFGGSAFTCSSSTTSFAFTPTATGCYSASVDTFVVWYAQLPGGGSFSWAIDAGGTTNVSTSNASTAVTSVTIPAGSLAAHTLNLWWRFVHHRDSGLRLNAKAS